MRPQPRHGTGLRCAPIVWTMRPYLLPHVVWQLSHQRTSAHRSFLTHVFLPRATHCTDQTIPPLWCCEERGSFLLLGSVLRARSLLSQHGEIDVFSWVMRTERCVFSKGQDSAVWIFFFTVATFGERVLTPSQVLAGVVEEGLLDYFNISIMRQLEGWALKPLSLCFSEMATVFVFCT